LNLKIGAILYCVWATLSITLSIAVAGFSAESITRLLVILFLLIQIAGRSILIKALPNLNPKYRFIGLGTVLAAVVEGFHMISMPVLPSLRIYDQTSLVQGLMQYGIDLLLTVPAYLVIFAVIWYFINRYDFGLWRYIIVMGIAQALGDGGIYFFLNAPAMLVFLPYPMTNYHAINIMPFLAVRANLRPVRPERSPSNFTYLAIPVLIGTYAVCGTAIKLLGKWLGL